MCVFSAAAHSSAVSALLTTLPLACCVPIQALDSGASAPSILVTARRAAGPANRRLPTKRPQSTAIFGDEDFSSDGSKADS